MGRQKREPLKVGVSGVRGVVGRSFTPSTALGFAQAFGIHARQGTVLVGRDTRPSGPMIEMAVVAGLQSVGCRPLLAGVVPTPTLLYLVRQHGAAGAIAITASHNAAPWNALKFVNHQGLFLNARHAEELFDIYHQQDFPLVPEAQLATASPLENPMLGHIGTILSYVNLETIRQRNFSVAVDCCNGVGAIHTIPFLEQLGCTVHAIHDTPNGIFQRPPEPQPKNIGALNASVQNNQCDVGFAQDPDGDRLALVDETGTPLGEDFTLAFGVRQVLAAHGKGPVAINQGSSHCVEDAAAPYDVEVVRTATGEVNVSETMLRIGAVVGGENSGGIIVPGVHPCRDSYTGMALILELMAMENHPLSAIRAEFPTYFLVKEKIEISPGQAPELMRAVRHYYADRDISLIDGVRIEVEGGWVQIRRSNTEPIIRIIAEASSKEQSEALVREANTILTKAM